MPVISNETRSCTAVVRGGRAFYLIAAHRIAAGTLLFRVEGRLTDRASYTSVQVGAHAHIDVDPTVGLLEQMDRSPWRFMNHSCSPNTRIWERDVVAIREVRPGEELTFNYNTTEWDMAVPFECQCGTPSCVGTVRGFRHLSRPEQRRLLPLVAGHLLSRAGVSASELDA